MTSRVRGCFIYARYSTENQQADSIEVQVKRCTEYCQRENLTVLGVYADYAVSGMKASRPQYDRMIADLKSGMASTVVVYDQSRLFRDMALWFQARKELELMDVGIISITQPFIGGDIRNPTVFAQEGMWALLNQLHVLQTSEKSKAALRHKAVNGLHTGGKPALGYRNENGRLVIDEEEAQVVRRIFREYASGMSYREIIAGLNSDGITTKLGNPWGANSLNALLRNEKYIGRIVYGEKVYRKDGTRNTAKPEGKDVIRIDNGLPAIVTPELWDLVHDRFAINAAQQRGRPAAVRNNPLKGKVLCGLCGGAMTMVSSKKKGKGIYYYFRCANKDRHHTCEMAPISADMLEELVVKHVRSIIGSPDIRQETMELLKQETARINQRGAERYKNLADELTRLDLQIGRIITAIENGAYSPTMNTRLQELESKKAQTESQLKSLRKAAEVAALPQHRLEELYLQVCTSAETDTAAVCSIVSKVIVYPNRIIVFTAFDPKPDGWTRQEIESALESTPEYQDSVMQNLGTSSGVPIFCITAIGLAFIAERKKSPTA